MKRAEPLEQEAKSFETRINSLTDTFSQFISRFVSWTRDKEGQLTEELIRLKEDLIRLERKLADLQNAYEAVSHVSQGITPIIGALSATFPPYSTVIAIGGLIFAGVSLAATTGLLVGIGRLAAKRDVAAKIKEKARLEEDIEFVRSAREGLEQTGTESVADFKSALVSMPALAAASRIDASEIKAWLDNGAPENGRPFYLVENSVNNVKSYSSMGEYFQTYARGIQALCTPGIVEKE
ncbi:hypothetical protein LOZ65_005676 [Ophidiomyces ophidiicola]|nr:hypothetical protein LOZ65_005676 [Ophidiomyces ophidiicola]